MRPIFKHTEHLVQYEQQGFIKHQLLNEQEIADLLEVYRSLNPGLDDSFYTSHTSADVEYKKKVDEAIRKVFDPKLDELFKDYRSVFGFFLVKTQGSETLELHLDWQFVDERKYTGFNIWCPLVDITKENGAIFAIPGSHKRIEILRGYNTPNPMHFLDQPVDESKLVTLPLKAGEALIFDLRLIHGAWPNTTPQPRIAAGMVAIPQEADILHFWAAAEERDCRDIEVYKMQPEFYMHNYNGSKPDKEHLLGVWHDDNREKTIASLGEAYSVKRSWFQKIFG